MVSTMLDEGAVVGLETSLPGVQCPFFGCIVGFQKGGDMALVLFGGMNAEFSFATLEKEVTRSRECWLGKRQYDVVGKVVLWTGVGLTVMMACCCVGAGFSIGEKRVLFVPFRLLLLAVLVLEAC